MDKREISNVLNSEKPRIVVVSGKTCTGKSTFASSLVPLGYARIELDVIVRNSVAIPYDVEPVEDAFVTAYRGEGPEVQTQAFIIAARAEIQQEIQISPVVIDGAISKSSILKKVFSDDLQDFFFIYFHPVHLESYVDRIRSRCVGGVRSNTTRLPKHFWTLVKDADLQEFLKTNVLNERLEKAFQEYAAFAVIESEERLNHFKESFFDIHVVEI